jgi:hypothetical protein
MKVTDDIGGFIEPEHPDERGFDGCTVCSFDRRGASDSKGFADTEWLADNDEGPAVREVEHP